MLHTSQQKVFVPRILQQECLEPGEVRMRSFRLRQSALQFWIKQSFSRHFQEPESFCSFGHPLQDLPLRLLMQHTLMQADALRSQHPKAA